MDSDFIAISGDGPFPESACLFPYKDLHCETAVDDKVRLQCRLVLVGPHRIKLLSAACSYAALEEETIGMHIWPGTHVMAYVLLSLEREGALAGRSLLDLGCGTGFLGILARSAGCSNVVLADHEECVLQAAALNIKANNVDKIHVQTMSWSMENQADSATGERFDLLLLSEVLYVAQPLVVPWDLDHADVCGLVSLTKTKLAPSGVAWVTYGGREESGAQQFQAAAQAAGLACTEVPLSQMVPPEELTRSGATALRRVQIFQLKHATNTSTKAEERTMLAFPDAAT